jgi:predicted regulator of amino acid metabolism with ACT domain
MSIFANAKSLAPEKPKTKKSNKAEIQLEGLEQFALLDSLIKSLEAVRDTYCDMVKCDAREIFAKADGKRPENFRGIDGDAEASIELRKRSSRSTLSEEEVATLTEHKVPFDVVDDVTETFVINPEYANDSALLGKIDKALGGVKGLPENFILRQAGVSRRVVSDATIDHVFAHGLASELMDTVTTLAVKAKLNVPNMQKALKLAHDVIDGKDLSKQRASADLMSNLQKTVKNLDKKGK